MPTVNFRMDSINFRILGLQSISQDISDNVSHPRRLVPTIELTAYILLCFTSNMAATTSNANHQYFFAQI